MTNFMRNFQRLSRHFATIATLCAILLPAVAFGAGSSSSNKKVVVLDAGHGGRFTGAYYNGISEKDINLKVVLKLGALIQKNMPNVKVVYTRTVDMHFSETLGVDLQARANIAHKHNADLFISVHSNAMPNKPEVRGTLTLIMGESSGEINRNNTALYNNNKEELLDMSDHKTATIVRAYIQNLQYTYGAYSEMLGKFIQDEYSKIGLRNHGVRGQPLKVLYSTDMPSVLTEIGFMSNPTELQIINSDEGQEKIARALYNAVARYIDALNSAQGIKATTTKLTPSKVTTPTATKSTEPEAQAQASAKPEVKKEEVKTSSTTATSEQPKAATTKRYTIQLMPAKEKIPVSNLNFKALQANVWILEVGGSWPYKYCYKEFTDYESAKKHLAEAQKYYPQAFIITFQK